MFVTGTSWNPHEGTPKHNNVQKPADFIPSDLELTPQGLPTTSASKTLFDSMQRDLRRRQSGKCNTVHPFSDLYRIPVYQHSLKIQTLRVTSKQTQKTV